MKIASFKKNGDLHVASEIIETDNLFRFSSDGKLYINEFIEGNNVRIFPDKKLAISGEIIEGIN